MYGICVLCVLFAFCSQPSSTEARMLRRTSTYQHPAFAMFMHSPMAFPGHTSGSVHQECIMGDIVCPSWCLMEDDWGCKTCPCGPANGMAPPTMSEHHVERHEEQHDCLGTMLCMLTCKDGYRLGPRGDNGCQSCSCIKKKQTTTAKPKTTTDATSSTTMSSQRLNTGTSSKGKDNHCKWPLCMNAQAPHRAPSAPGGSGTNGAGGFVSPKDCFGPSCSAKNGMRLINEFGEHKGGVPTPAMLVPTPPPPRGTPVTSSADRRCPMTDACVKVCHHKVQLTPPLDPGGCPGCKCVQVSVATPAPSRCSLVVEKCKNNCREGFEVIPDTDGDGCPRCTCLKPNLPVPLVVAKERPNVLSFCPDTVHCMESCKNGYTLTDTEAISGCPKCSCTRGQGNTFLSVIDGLNQGHPVLNVVPTASVSSNNTGSVTDHLTVNTDESHKPGYVTGSGSLTSIKGVDAVIVLPVDHRTSSVDPGNHGPLQSAAEACPDAVRCIVGCGGKYHLTQSSGASCPTCHCDHKVTNASCTTPPCADSSNKGATHTILSPGQCVAVLHCVMTCTAGYDVGDNDTNGCPTCSCLDL